MQTEIRSYIDVVDHLMDWMGTGSSDPQVLRKAKRAVENAYREIAAVRQWTYFETRGQFTTSAQQVSSTITFDYTGGAFERVVTIAAGTWPSWAKFGVLKIANVEYEIASRESSTEITLSVNSNPGEDVAAGTSYYLYRDSYPTPVNFQSIGPLRESTYSLWPQCIPPNDLISIKTVGQMPTFPRNYAIMSDPNYVGSLAFRFYPPPDAVYNYEYMYIRRPRGFGTYQYTTGTVANSGATVTGTGTAWTTNMIGCTFRFSATSTAPTGTVGSNPWVEQRVITGWTSATSVTLDQAPSGTYSGVAYEISDLIDIEAGAMYTAFLRRCEWEMGILMHRNDVPALAQVSKMALIAAKESDSRYNDTRPADARVWRRVPITWTTTSLP